MTSWSMTQTQPLETFKYFSSIIFFGLVDHKTHWVTKCSWGVKSIDLESGSTTSLDNSERILQDLCFIIRYSWELQKWPDSTIG